MTYLEMLRRRNSFAFVEIDLAKLGFCHRYPRFLCGRGLIAVVFVLGVTTEDRNSEPLCSSRSVFSESNFDSFNKRCAAFAALLGLFFAFGINSSLLIFDYPTASNHLFAVIEDRCLPWRDGALRLIENNAGAVVLHWVNRSRRRFVAISDFHVGTDQFRRFIE